MEKFPVEQGISPNRVSRNEEAIYDDAERDLVSNLAEPEDRNRITLLIQILLIIHLVFTDKGRTGSFLHNLHRAPIKVDKKLLSVLFISFLISKGSFGDISELLGISRTSIDRVRPLVVLVSLFLGISGLRKEFDLQRQMSEDDSARILEPTCQRVESFEFLSRMIMVEGLSKISLVLIPLFDIRKLLSRVARAVLPLVDTLESSVCSVCRNERLVFPFIAYPCGDVYCYFCYRTKDQTEDCTKCRKHISSWKSFNS